jgi:cell division septation protein DedD
MAQQDTEIVLGTGKLLVIFFAAVVLCGAFFGMGYSVGRSSVPLTAQAGDLAQPQSPPVANGVAKPNAGVTVVKPAAPDCATSATGCTPEQLAANSAAAKPAEKTPDAPGDDAQAESTAPPQKPLLDVNAKATPPELASPGSGIMVQVAAVSKQEDADALVNALKRKNYPVLMVPGSNNDRLFHVQVGPFAKLQDAEAARARLSNDGYNAIVKK